LAQDPLNTLVAIGDGWSRYFLCLPGSILASIGLFRQASQMRSLDLSRIARYLTGAALAFLVYAIVGGIFVPTSPIFPANLINYSLLNETIRVPAPVFRSLCGLAMALFVVRSLEVFQVEVDRRLATMEQAQILAADRERIGRELHDGIVQKIYAAGLGLEEAHHLIAEDAPGARQQIRTVMDALNRTIQDIRHYIFDLRIAEQNRELEIVLEDLVRELRVDTLLHVDFEVTGQRCCWLDSDQVAQVTQIAREALSNVVQHANATQVTVSLSYLGNLTRLDVTDNGQGMEPNPLPGSNHYGQGIANMRKRAHLLGGELEIMNGQSQGVSLVLTIPCDGDKQPKPETEEQELWA
jgi:signal transduction histidine kinase